MKTKKHTFAFERTALALFCAASVVACATSEAETPIVVTPDAAASETSSPDASTDGAPTTDSSVASDTATDVAVPADAESCTYPQTETRACGFCGTQSRFCLPQGVYTGWTDCVGERGDAECKVGEKRTNPCGNCGKAIDFCDVKTCTWITGLCAGEGPCAPGDTDTTKASCTVTGEVRARTCTEKCEWGSFGACSIPKGWLPMEPAPITGRIFHSAVWTGSKMIVWGGYGSSPTYKLDGASYDFASNKWTTIASAPSNMSAGRREHAAVWTGSKMLIWGGRSSSTVYKDGAAYDPATDSWTTIPDAPLTVRHSVAAVWSPTTNEMLVWGGCTGTTCSSVAGDGAAYDPTTNTWTALPAAPIAARGDAAGVWTGTDFLIFGGINSSTVGQTDGARFDPVTRAWTKFSSPPSTIFDPRYDGVRVWNGSSLFMWGGRASSTSSTAKANGAFYTPGVGWTEIPEASDTVLSPSGARYDAVGWFGSGKLYVFSGIGRSGNPSVFGFAAFDPVTATWSAPDSTGAPGARARATVVWTGKEALVWGGAEDDTTSPYYETGGIYRP